MVGEDDQNPYAATIVESFEGISLADSRRLVRLSLYRASGLAFICGLVSRLARSMGGLEFAPGVFIDTAALLAIMFGISGFLVWRLWRWPRRDGARSL